MVPNVDREMCQWLTMDILQSELEWRESDLAPPIYLFSLATESSKNIQWPKRVKGWKAIGREHKHASLHGFPLGTVVFSHMPKACWWVNWLLSELALLWVYACGIRTLESQLIVHPSMASCSLLITLHWTRGGWKDPEWIRKTTWHQLNLETPIQ